MSSSTEWKFAKDRLLGVGFREALSALTIAELRAERNDWSKICKLWDYDISAPDWLRSLAHEHLQACEAAFRLRRS